MNKWIWSEDKSRVINLAHVNSIEIMQAHNHPGGWILIAWVGQGDDVTIKRTTTREDMEAFITKQLCNQLDVIWC